jgi:hypothetical protein
MLRTSIVTLLIACAVAMLSFARRQREPESEFLWRPESLRASVLRNDFFGQFLNLDQELHAGEGGWTNMKICIPQHWHAHSVFVAGDRVVLTLSGGVKYSVNRDNVGDLSFQVSDGGPGKSDEILEQIWDRCAREQNA